MVILSIAAMGLFLNGCGYFSQFDNFENSRQLRVGMSEEQVLAIMGEPLQESFSQKDVWFYYIETRWSDGQNTIDECMPLVFKDGKLAGWGNDYYTREKLYNSYERPQIEGLE